MANIYTCVDRQPVSEEFSKSVAGVALLLKRSKVDGKLAIINAASSEILWVTTTIQHEERDVPGTDLVIETSNSVYTFRKIGETV